MRLPRNPPLYNRDVERIVATIFDRDHSGCRGGPKGRAPRLRRLLGEAPRRPHGRNPRTGVRSTCRRSWCRLRKQAAARAAERRRMTGPERRVRPTTRIAHAVHRLIVTVPSPCSAVLRDQQPRAGDAQPLAAAVPDRRAGLSGGAAAAAVRRRDGRPGPLFGRFATGLRMRRLETRLAATQKELEGLKARQRPGCRPPPTAMTLSPGPARPRARPTRTMLAVDAAGLDRALDRPALIEALREAFRGEAEAPLRHHHTVPTADGDATLLIMPAWEAGTAIGIKLVTLMPGNPANGLPSSSAPTSCSTAPPARRGPLDGPTLTSAPHRRRLGAGRRLSRPARRRAPRHGRHRGDGAASGPRAFRRPPDPRRRGVGPPRRAGRALAQQLAEEALAARPAETWRPRSDGPTSSAARPARGRRSCLAPG